METKQYVKQLGFIETVFSWQLAVKNSEGLSV